MTKIRKPSHWNTQDIESRVLVVDDPFFFVMDPALLGEGSTSEVVWATLRAVLAFSLISVASAGCFLSALGPSQRLVTFAVVIPLLAPYLMYQSLGFVAGVVILFWFWFTSGARVVKG